MVSAQECVADAGFAAVRWVFDNELSTCCGGGGEEGAYAICYGVSSGKLGGVAGRRWNDAGRTVAETNGWRAGVALTALAFHPVVSADRKGGARGGGEHSEEVTCAHQVQQVLVECVAEDVVRWVAVDRVVVHKPDLKSTLLQESAEAIFTSVGAGAQDEDARRAGGCGYARAPALARESERRVEPESRAGAVRSCNSWRFLLRRVGAIAADGHVAAYLAAPHRPASRRLVAAVDQPTVACLAGAWHAPDEGSRCA